MIAEHNNTQLCSKRVQHFVFLDGEDAHGRDSAWGAFFMDGSVFGKTYFDIGILGLYTGFPLAETCHPGVTIEVRDMETSE